MRKIKALKKLKKLRKLSLSLVGMLLTPVIFALGSSAPAGGGAIPSGSIEQQILQVLTQIQTQLQNISTQQTQMQQNFQGYTQFELQKSYPSIPFPGWESVSVSPAQRSASSNSGINNLNLLLQPNSQANYQSMIKTQVLQNTQQLLAQPLSDSGVSGELNNYISLVNNTSQTMTPIQAQRLQNQLLVLNTKAVYTQIQEEKRLEALLTAQLFIQAQQKPTEGSSK